MKRFKQIAIVKNQDERIIYENLNYYVKATVPPFGYNLLEKKVRPFRSSFLLSTLEISETAKVFKILQDPTFGVKSVSKKVHQVVL